MRQPAAVIFDLDGTLVDSAPDIRRAINAVLAYDGLPPLGIKAVQLMIGGGPAVLVSRALDELGITAESGNVARLTESFEQIYLEQGNVLTTLFQGVVSCLENLKNYDLPIGLCSNKPEQLCQRLLADLGIAHFFSAIQGSGSGLPTKPHPAVLLSTLRRLETTPELALYVGDSKTDVDTARAAGVPVALVNGGYTAAPATTLGADWVVDDLAGIPSIWQKSKSAN